MTLKQAPHSVEAPDGSTYVCITDGNGNLQSLVTSAGSGTKKTGFQAPDGSEYITVTDGNGNLT
jgi:hypothetical protein